MRDRPEKNAGYERKPQQLGAVRKVLLAAVRRTCPPWLASDAEDIVQEALLKILPRLEEGEGNGELASSYLWRVAYSATIDEIRRRRRRREVPMDSEMAVLETSNPGPSPERLSLSGDLGRAIRDCLTALGPGRRNAVTLRLLGHSIRETASLLGWAVKRAENMIYRGLADLRACLGRKGLQP